MKGDVISLGSVSPRDWGTIEKHYFCIEWYVFMPRERLSNPRDWGPCKKHNLCIKLYVFSFGSVNPRDWEPYTKHVGNCKFSVSGALIYETGNLVKKHDFHIKWYVFSFGSVNPRDWEPCKKHDLYIKLVCFQPLER